MPLYGFLILLGVIEKHPFISQKKQREDADAEYSNEVRKTFFNAFIPVSRNGSSLFHTVAAYLMKAGSLIRCTAGTVIPEIQFLQAPWHGFVQGTEQEC